MIELVLKHEVVGEYSGVQGAPVLPRHRPPLLNGSISMLSHKRIEKIEIELDVVAGGVKLVGHPAILWYVLIKQLYDFLVHLGGRIKTLKFLDGNSRRTERLLVNTLPAGRLASKVDLLFNDAIDLNDGRELCDLVNLGVRTGCFCIKVEYFHI